MTTPTAQQRIGPYELQARIGQGGMGEVWKARDLRVDRTVAIKFSQSAFGDRFERETKAIAALNHSNICTLHDIGPNYIVMEFVDGQPVHGPLPLELALGYADQILDALDHAHRNGIVHRDLKPGNILVSRGRIKLLDFGLAKFQQSSAAAVRVDDRTITTALTAEGTLLGTLHYMAPEQVEGKNADERSDIFSAGCVLYELITGKRPFEGDSAAAVIAAILEKKPAPVEPERVNRVIEICLAKDPDERWQHARDLRQALRLSLEPSTSVSTPARSPGRWKRTAWTGVAAALSIAAGIAAARWAGTAVTEGPVRFQMDAPPGLVFNYMITATSVSPDGNYVVFRTGGGSNSPMLWLRPLDSLEARLLPGTDGADFPFWSPDSKSIGFFAQEKLKRIDLAQGTPLDVCDVVFGSSAAGGAWNRDGVIVFSDKRGLFRVGATGGAPARLIASTESDGGFGYPQFLPDGKRFLYFAAGNKNQNEALYLSSLAHPESRTLVLKTQMKALFAPALPGHEARLLYVRDRTLYSQRVDPDKLKLAGDPEMLARDVAILPSLHAASFWVSDTGVLVYRSGTALERARIVLRDRQGRKLSDAGPEDSYMSLRISPDGRRAAVVRRDAGTPGLIWILDLGRSLMTRLTAQAQLETRPAWSPDGRQIAFTEQRAGVYQIMRIRSDGMGAEEALTEGPLDHYLTDWSRDGKYLLYSRGSPGSFDIWALANPGGAGRRDFPILATSFDESDGQFSLDGKWIAYASNLAGHSEVFVMGFAPESGTANGRWQISKGGGRAPRWRGNGQELFYLTTDTNRLMSVKLRTSGAGLEAESPTELFTTSAPADSGANPSPYDVTADGQKFLMEETAGAQLSIPLTAVLHWQSSIKK